jgi:hypothetical protein
MLAASAIHVVVEVWTAEAGRGGATGAARLAEARG